jgi:uncharacterized damage-inducible protein DinB
MATAKDVIRSTIESSNFFVSAYLNDLSDADLLAVPVKGMNPIAWQLGHMLTVHADWLEKIAPGSTTPLPEGFAAAHSKETAAPNAFSPVATKAEYTAAWEAQIKAALAVLDALPADKLDAETGIEFAPTVAAMLNTIGVHVLSHAGQFVAVRRQTGKPVAI